jgi:hypothetical protein
MQDRVLPRLAGEVPAGASRAGAGHDGPSGAATGLCPEPQVVAAVPRPNGNGGAESPGTIAPDARPQHGRSVVLERVPVLGQRRRGLLGRRQE